MLLRIKSVLIWGGLYIWFNFILTGILLLCLFINLPDWGNSISESPILPILFYLTALFLFIKPFDFSKIFSENLYCFFLFIGWLPYLHYPVSNLTKTDNSCWIFLFIVSTVTAISRFPKMGRSQKAKWITFILVCYAIIMTAQLTFI